MADSVSFEIRDLHRHDQPAPDSWHFHGLLRIRLDEDWVEYPQPVCVNDWLKALLGVQREVAFGDRTRDPTTFFLSGPRNWPLFEAIRMYDSLRIALLQDGEALAKSLVSVTDFQLAVEEHLHHVFQDVLSQGGDPPTMPGHLARWKCRQFSAKQAGAGVRSGADLVPCQPAVVICLRADQMIGEPTAGSYHGRCPQCNAEILIAPSSEVMISQGADVLCLSCAAQDQPGIDTERREEIARLKAKAEAAYDAIYQMHDDRQIAWKAELAEDWLRSAARLEREAGLAEDADATEKRAQHIRKVYRHQFLQPPDPWA
jgi:hypothetical protein